MKVSLSLALVAACFLAAVCLAALVLFYRMPAADAAGAVQTSQPAAAARLPEAPPSPLSTSASASADAGAVTAPFAQLFRQDYGRVMGLSLLQSGFQLEWTAPGSEPKFDPAVVETPDGSFVLAWQTDRALAAYHVSEIYYTIINRRGETARPVAKLADHSAALVNTYDMTPVIAVSPDGSIALAWVRELYYQIPYRYLYNIYMAMFDQFGNVIMAPTNITNHTQWRTSASYNTPLSISPAIAATDDNRFVLAWMTDTLESAGTIDDIWFAVRDSLGTEVRPASQLTQDVSHNSFGYNYATVAPVSGQSALLTFTRSGSGSEDVLAALLDSSGHIVRPVFAVTSDGHSRQSDAVELSNGSLLIGWTQTGQPSSIGFTILNHDGSAGAGPGAIENPLAQLGNGCVSVTADRAEHGILTWLDLDNANGAIGSALFYALAGSDAAVITPAQVLRTAPPGVRLDSSCLGYGNTPYGWIVASGIDAFVSLRSALVPSPPQGSPQLNITFGNNGLATAGGAVLTVTLDSRLSYISDTSGITPTASVDGIVWHLPDLPFMAEQSFAVHLSVPEATIGALFPVTLTVSSAQADANPADNTAAGTVMVATRRFLPFQTSMK